MLRVKICGITTRVDAEAALESGADALGFNLWPGSRRYVALASAVALATDLPKRFCRVAVVVDPTFEEASRIFASGCFDALQLHGCESAEFCRRLRDAGIAFIKAIAISDRDPDHPIEDFSTDSLLLDSRSNGNFGGTGKTFPWELARNFVAHHPEMRVWLAGGLTVENVTEAVRLVRPHGVDVTTGVERVAGEKDHASLRAFIDAAKAS